MYDDYYLEQLARQRHEEFRREVEAARLAKVACSEKAEADEARRRAPRLAGALGRLVAALVLRPVRALGAPLPRSR